MNICARELGIIQETKASELFDDRVGDCLGEFLLDQTNAKLFFGSHPITQESKSFLFGKIKLFERGNIADILRG